MALPYKFAVTTLIEEGRTTKSAIEQIKEWLQTTSIPQMPEELICLFLLSCKNETVQTKNTIEAYFKIKSAAPEIFKYRDIDREDLKKAMKVITCCSLPGRMENNTVIHFFKLNDTNYKNFDLVVNTKLTLMLIDVSQRYNPPNELVVVIDMYGAGLKHLTCVKFHAVKVFMDFMQEAMPLKIKAIHVLNANYMFDKCLSIAKMFMKGDLLAAIKPHSPKMNIEEFHRDYIPASSLPREYGGELPGTEELNQMAIQQFQELKQFFEAEESLISSYRQNQ